MDLLLVSPADLCVAATAVLAAAALVTCRSRSSSALPCPASTLPLLGNTLDTMSTQHHRLYDWLWEQSELFLGKPWCLSVLGRPTAIVITSPAAFEDVLKTQNDVFEKGPQSRFLVHDLFGEGILAADGANWFFQRKTASHLFSLQMMKNVMHDTIRDKTMLLRQVLAAHARSGDVVSLKQLLCHFTSDVFARIGFGVELNCLRDPDHPVVQDANGDDVEELIAALGDCNRMVQCRLQQPMWLWRLKRALNVGDERQYALSLGVINTWTNKIIAASMAAKASADPTQEKETSQAKDLIALFLESKIHEQVNVKNDVQLVRDMVMNFIFAGKDTTSQAMAWFFVMMNQHPHVLTAMRAELDAKLPGLRDGSMAVPCMEDLKQLVYLEAVIRENLRLNPPVPLSARTANKDTVMYDGTFVPAHTRVVMASYASARMASVWGPDAEEFKPERWIDEEGKLVSVSPYKYSPFLAGPRICLGMKFAMLEMKIALAVLVSAFDIQTVEDPHTTAYELSLTLSVKGPLNVRVHARS